MSTISDGSKHVAALRREVRRAERDCLRMSPKKGEMMTTTTTNEKGETVTIEFAERICDTDSASEQIANFMADYADTMTAAIAEARDGNGSEAVYGFCCATSSARKFASDTRADDSIADMMRSLALDFATAMRASHRAAADKAREEMTGAGRMADLAAMLEESEHADTAVTALYDSDATRPDYGSAEWQDAVSEAEREAQHLDKRTRELADELTDRLRVTVETSLLGCRDAANEAARIAAIDMIEERLADAVSNAADFARRVVTA